MHKIFEDTAIDRESTILSEFDFIQEDYCFTPKIHLQSQNYLESKTKVRNYCNFKRNESDPKNMTSLINFMEKELSFDNDDLIKAKFIIEKHNGKSIFRILEVLKIETIILISSHFNLYSMTDFALFCGVSRERSRQIFKKMNINFKNDVLKNVKHKSTHKKENRNNYNLKRNKSDSKNMTSLINFMEKELSFDDDLIKARFIIEKHDGKSIFQVLKVLKVETIILIASNFKLYSMVDFGVFCGVSRERSRQVFKEMNINFKKDIFNKINILS